MNHPDDFHKDDLNSKDVEPTQEQREHIDARSDAAPKSEPRWYSVSNEDFVSYPCGHAPVKRKRKVAAVALILAACLLVSVGAGFLGALLIDNWRADRYAIDLPVEGEGNKFPTNTDTSGVSQGIDYPYVEEDYDYAAAFAELSKNSNDALLSSPNGSAGDGVKSLIEMTAAVKDSVVEISTAVVSNRGTISAGAGSGVIIHEDGIIVTNNHVIEDCDQIVVRLTNGDTYEAALRGTDERGDIAIIKITPQQDKPLTVAKLGYSKALALGEPVVAIGNPLGQLGGTVTNGIISALEREINVDGNTMTLLQTNAAINAGNSGGALFNMAGELVGVVNAKYSATGVEGLGFAIPIDTAFEQSFADLFRYGYIRGIPTLGLVLTDHTDGNIIFPSYGAYVQGVGAQSDVRQGDYIYSINGTVVYLTDTSAVAAVERAVRGCRVGDTVSVMVLRYNKDTRQNEQIELSLVLVEYVPDYITS